MFGTGTFVFNGKTLPYLRADYGNTSNNERAIEVPIALRLHNNVEGQKETLGKILEVGCVTPHYFQDWTAAPDLGDYPHIVIDKYEDFPGVLSEDITEWSPTKDKKYDLIFSISTMEHIFDTSAILHVDKFPIWVNTINKMRSWLSETGLMMITLPYDQPEYIGGGLWMDYLLDMSADRKTKIITEMDVEVDPSWLPDKLIKMNRSGFGDAGNRWTEVPIHGSSFKSYDSTVPSTGTCLFLFWGNLNRL